MLDQWKFLLLTCLVSAEYSHEHARAGQLVRLLDAVEDFQLRAQLAERGQDLLLGVAFARVVVGLPRLPVSLRELHDLEKLFAVHRVELWRHGLWQWQQVL